MNDTRIPGAISRTRSRPTQLLATMFMVAAWLLPGLAAAQGSFSQSAAAEALFRDGAKLFDDGELAQACEKFAASQELEPAPGTALRLADCYDRIGKTASAWATFQQAAALANSSGQADREEIALERAEDLFGRLSYLKIDVAEVTRSLDGVEVLLNGTAIPEGTWGTPIPLDPGPQSVMARAPGHRAWEEEISIASDPGEQSIEVPALVPLETEDRPKGATRESRKAAAPVTEDPQESSSTQRVLAYVAGGVGVAALGAGGYFTYRAYRLNDQSLPECLVDDANACTSRGKQLRDDARKQGTLATIAAGAGFALVGASVVLLLTAPDEAPTTGTREVRLVAGATSGGAAVALGGTW